VIRFGRIIAIAALVLCAGSAASATTYPPVTFSELVARADVIFVGEVVDVRPFPWRTRRGTLVKTRVVFRVWDPIFGTTSAMESFDFLGGRWGELEVAVAEMPRFTIGDRRVVFARREPGINPIVGFTQGLLRIGRDAQGVDRVFTLGGAPLVAPEGIGMRQPQTAPAMAAAPMELTAFRSRVARALTEARRR
jgi:hypothetical protein